MKEETPVVAYTSNVVLLQQDDKVIGFISSAKTYKCEPLDSDELARLIDQKFGVVSRAVKQANQHG